MLEKSRHAVEKALRKRGFAAPDVRRIMAGHIVLTAAALILGAVLYTVSLWPLAFGLGSVMASVNLWSLARSLHRTLGHSFSGARAMAYFAGFALRFAGTAAALYILLVRAALPVAPVLAGLSSALVWLMILGISRFAGNSCKEA